MYSEESISFLVNRIGFGEPSMDIPNIVVSDDNKYGTSGRTFNYFHKLVTLDNIYDTANDMYMQSDEFNAYLLQIKIDAARGVLSRILSQNISCLSSTDYSDMILLRPELFEDAYGYSVAYTLIEQMISTTRSNIKERNAKMAYQQLKIELEGAKNEYGYSVASGVNHKLAAVIKIATDIICPSSKLKIFDATNIW